MGTKSDRIKELELLLVDMLDESVTLNSNLNLDVDHAFDRGLIRRAQSTLGLAPRTKVKVWMMGGWVCLIPEADGFNLDKRVEGFDIPSTPKALAKFVSKIVEWCGNNGYVCVNIKDGKMSIG